MQNFRFNGLLKEDEMVLALNKRTFSELNGNLKRLLNSLFGAIDPCEIILCEKTKDFIKPDFIITCKNISLGISMKSGSAVIVHNEIVTNFISFIRRLRVSEKTIETILLFHFGDGTTDGTGTKRLSTSEVREKLADRIIEANQELNSDLKFIYEVVYHCVFKGAKEENLEADAIYYGDVDNGVVATQKQLFKNMQRRGFDYYDCLHIGPLLIRPDSRYADTDIIDERKRNRIVMYWPNLRSEIDYVSRRYDF